MNRAFLTGMSAYRNVNINTRNVANDPHELVAMMFDGLIESVTRAKGAVVNRETQTKVAEITRAIRILQEGLLTSLDLDNGGELAQNLSNLYEYCVIRLTQANAQNSLDALDEVANLIKPVAEAWRQMRNATPSEARPDALSAVEARPSPSIPPSAPPSSPPSVRRVSHTYGAGLSLQGA